MSLKGLLSSRGGGAAPRATPVGPSPQASLPAAVPSAMSDGERLAMLDQLEAGRWELHVRGPGGAAERVCFRDARRLIQLRLLEALGHQQQMIEVIGIGVLLEQPHQRIELAHLPFGSGIEHALAVLEVAPQHDVAELAADLVLLVEGIQRLQQLRAVLP